MKSLQLKRNGVYLLQEKKRCFKDTFALLPYADLTTKMNFTKRQLVLLTTALTLFYDEIAKTAKPEFKAEVMEIAEMVQDAYEKSE